MSASLTRKPAPRATQLKVVGKTPPARPRTLLIDAVAERRFRVIHPLVTPGEFQRLHAQFKGKRPELIRLIGQQWGIAERTIYHWLKAWKRGGVEALCKKTRSDCGKPQRLSAAAIDFLLASAVPGPNTDGERSIREIHLAYLRERDLRRAQSDRFKSDQQLPKVSYETVRVWLSDIPNLARAKKAAQQSIASGF